MTSSSPQSALTLRSRLRPASLLAALFACLLAPIASNGAQPATQPATRSSFDRTMTVSPARAEDAAAPGRDLPQPFAFSQETLALRNENAATLYLQAFAALPRMNEEETARWNQLMETPFDRYDIATARAALEPCALSLNLSEPAVRRTWCDWGAPLQEQGIATLLPYLNQSRMLANAMREQIKLHLAEGDIPAARQMLRRLYVLGLHVGNARQPVLVDGLVGTGIVAMAVDITARGLERPEARNHYWALTTLPTPLFDVPAWIRAERVFLTVSLPALGEPEHMTAERWAETLRQLHGFMSMESGEDTGAARIATLLRDTAATAAVAEAARRHFRERGYTDAELEAMGQYPMMSRFLMDDYQSRFDAMAKLMHLPFHQARPRLVELEQQIARRGGESQAGVGLLADLLLPSLTRALAAPYRLERQVAALRIVEAVRDHAAHHDGRPPAALADVRLPIPLDPMTGEAFQYEASGDAFTITAARYDAADPNSGFVWRVTLRR